MIVERFALKTYVLGQNVGLSQIKLLGSPAG
jgi:hypothetical protein